MKKLFTKLLPLFLTVNCLCLNGSLISVQAAAQPVTSENIFKNNKDTRDQIVTSYLFDNGTGLTRVEHIEDQVVIENYSSDFRFLSSRFIPDELPIWGGFYHAPDANYLIYGANNFDQDDSKEVVRAIKYSLDWKRLGQASISDVNTDMPFFYGSLRCTYSAPMLYLHTAHGMYNGHQANWRLALNTSTMEFTDSLDDVSGIYSGYVAHSWNQFILVDGNDLISVDEGDSYPRALELVRFINRAGEETYTEELEHYSLFDIPGEVGENRTGVSLGGLSKTYKGYHIAFAYTNKPSLTPAAEVAGSQEVFVSSLNMETGKVEKKKLSEKPGCGRPAIVPLSDTEGYIFWNTYTPGTDELRDDLYFVHYENGNYSVPEKTRAPLSDCQPIVYNGKIVWYSTQTMGPVFYQFDGSEVTTFDRNPLYPDVDTSSLDYSGIFYSRIKGLMTGYATGDFGPNNILKRGEFITVLYRLMEEPSTWSTPFSDVKESDYYYKASLWARARGIMTGNLYMDGTRKFDGEDPVTKQDVALVLYRIAEIMREDMHMGPLTEYYSVFDPEVGSWAKDGVKWAVSNNLMRFNVQGGFDEPMRDVLQAGSNATRGWIATFLQRYLCPDFTGSYNSDFYFSPNVASGNSQIYSLNTVVSSRLQRSSFNPNRSDCIQTIRFNSDGSFQYSTTDGKTTSGNWKVEKTPADTIIKIRTLSGGYWFWPVLTTSDYNSCIMTSSGILTPEI